MQVDQFSKLMQLYQIQNSVSSSDNSSSDGSNPVFSKLLEEMMKNTSTNTIDSNGKATAVNGIESLSVDPQKLFKMMQISSMENMMSSSSSTDIGSVSSDDDSSEDEIGNIPSENTDMSQLFDYILQSMNENQDTGSTASDDSSNTNSSAQVDKK